MEAVVSASAWTPRPAGRALTDEVRFTQTNVTSLDWKS